MKRKIKDLGTIISEFYKEHEVGITLIIFTIIGAVMLSIFVYKDYEPEQISKTEVKYIEEKAKEIIDNDLRGSTNIIKEMKGKGYYVDFDFENEKITIKKNGNTKAIVTFSYSSTDISMKISYDNANFETMIAMVLGAFLGFLIWVVWLIIPMEKLSEIKYKLEKYGRRKKKIGDNK